ncbi:MAG: NAD(P)-dependent oxidoreductase [Methylacidiphilales bacterium]|nr:NAD(P)-dependent oxidoreductase [Candidatus Methylacidiphilales bacterium]MDW8348732.1 NAD(P)-dependent oxidoreductase [Verrucomicrobiae bacterium]
MQSRAVPYIPPDVSKILRQDLNGLLHQQAILISGGSGFVGKWLLEVAAWGKVTFGIIPECLFVVSRRPERLQLEMPHLFEVFSQRLQLISADLTQPQCVSTIVAKAQACPRRVSLIIHGAAEVSAQELMSRPTRVIPETVTVMRHMLTVANALGSQKFLFTSSGAVYGVRSHSAPLEETSLTAPDTRCSQEAYGEAKRCAEMMLACWAAENPSFEPIIARLFAFVGPYLSLDSHYAVSYFLRSALRREPLIVRNPSAIRSYQHGFEMAAMLWSLAARGKPREIYNIGSDTALDVLTLAKQIADLCGLPVRLDANLATPSLAGQTYLPSMTLTHGLCGYTSWLSIKEALEQTISWHRSYSLIE